ncbi:tryptophan halogenase family protein [Hephaestia sp. GCM10023244]|uniref:tryptophan halogenase family protein n=1 Tax=unclassified Hephaestia TaxID=2631281 RepID=UPI002076DB3A|nr:tryptophan halogenase family protein [Hephaestia sp. MAHUQ-44]MCM8732158.1 tryptophan 7-halogenase [Hephaestia sp. MAHUQ-44]
MTATAADRQGAPRPRVVIAGGGTAGWIAAAALVQQLGPLLDITLVESDEIGTVGVGESTIPTTRGFHSLIGLDERLLVRETGSTFKLGILFEEWAGPGDRYIHSFGEVGKSIWMAPFHHLWMQGRAWDVAGELGDYCYELQAAKALKFATGKGARINYAYHLDATAYGRLLRSQAEPAGVRRVEGRITTIEQDPETGMLTALVLQSGMRIEGDFFIDCTGFRAMLIGQTLGVGFEDWGHWLTTDRAIAVQTTPVEAPVPYTRVIAHEAGWRWEIPLRHRMGNGLVYSSAYLDDDAARTRLVGAIRGEMLAEPRVIRYATGRRRKAWEKNCVALGLAGGFVEPLESTSIHLMQIAITRLIQSFPFGGDTSALAERFNAQSQAEIERVRDFIILHYKLAERNDTPFWKMCREMAIPASLEERIALFVESAVAYQGADDLFRVDSWVQVMLGQGITPRSFHAVGQLLGPDKLKTSLADLKRNIADAVAAMPSHADFLRDYCEQSSPA